MTGMNEFEGATVAEFKAKFPAISVECEPYKRGTILRLAVEVRVKGVHMAEDQKTGEMVRHHILGIEDIDIVSSFDPSQNVAQVSGSASGQPTQTPEEAEELGVDIGRTSDSWPQQIAVKGGNVINVHTGDVIGAVDDVTDEDVEENVKKEAEANQDRQREQEEAEEPEMAMASNEIDPGF